jgi:hypothetical protein
MKPSSGHPALPAAPFIDAQQGVGLHCVVGVETHAAVTAAPDAWRHGDINAKPCDDSKISFHVFDMYGGWHLDDSFDQFGFA